MNKIKFKIILILIINVKCKNDSNTSHEQYSKEIISCWTLIEKKGWMRMASSNGLHKDESGELGIWCFNKDSSFLQYDKKGKLLSMPFDVVVERKWRLLNDSIINIYGEDYQILSKSDDTLKLYLEAESVGDSYYNFTLVRGR